MINRFWPNLEFIGLFRKSTHKLHENKFIESRADTWGERLGRGGGRQTEQRHMTTKLLDACRHLCESAKGHFLK